MSKVRIYVEQSEVSDFIALTEKSVIHKLKTVLRFKNGDKLRIFNGKGKEYSCRIEDLGRKKIILKKEIILVERKAPQKELVLGFPVMRESKIDFILQKATEVGVSRFIPFTCERSLKLKQTERKNSRWLKIILEAVRQSDRLWIPKIDSILDFSRIISLKYENKIAGGIKSKNTLDKINMKNSDILFMVGPEGDFSSEEYEQLKARDFDFITLSKNILKTETAAIFGCGLLSYYFDLI